MRTAQPAMIKYRLGLIARSAFDSQGGTTLACAS